MPRSRLFRTYAVEHMRADINDVVRRLVTRWTSPTLWPVDTDPAELRSLAVQLDGVAANAQRLADTARRQATVMEADTEPDLTNSAVYRTAAKTWKCQCPGNGHNNCTHVACQQEITHGDRYVEYLGEAEPYGSGIRYCLPCGVVTWTAQKAGAQR